MTKGKIIAIAIIGVLVVGSAIFFFGPKKVIKQVAAGNQGTTVTRTISRNDVSEALTPYFKTEEAQTEHVATPSESKPADATNPAASPSDSAPTTVVGTPAIEAAVPKGKNVTKAVSYDGKANTEMESDGGDFQKISVVSKLDDLGADALTKSICEHLDPTFLAVCYDKTLYTRYIAFVRTTAEEALKSGVYGKETMTGTDQDLDIELVFDTEAKLITLTIQK